MLLHNMLLGRRFVLILMVLANISHTTAQGQGYDFSFLDEVMEDSIDHWGVRGASIAFFDKNSMTEPIVRGYGRTASSATSPQVTADTTFMLASVSKVFAGTLVLKLVDLGILSSIDDDICDVYGEITTACRNPHFPDIPVTWRMLVTHRSSLRADIPSYPSDDSDWGYLEASYGPTGGYYGLAAGQATCPMEDVVGFYRDILIDKESETIVGMDLGVNWYQLAQRQLGGMWRSNYPPGGRSVYSNFAVGYIAALIELLTGQTFPDFTKEHIFEPLGMNNTAWFRRDLPSNVVEAMPVETNWRGKKFNDIGHYCFIDYASGSLRTSATDLAKFLDSMLDLGVPTLWSESSGLDPLVCFEENSKGQPVSNCEFGANWILMNNQDKKNADDWLQAYAHLDWTHAGQHDGYEAGCQTQIMVFPTAGVYVVVLTNTDGNDEWAPQMMAMDLMDEVRSSLASSCTILPSWMALVLPLVVVACIIPWFM